MACAVQAVLEQLQLRVMVLVVLQNPPLQPPAVMDAVTAGHLAAQSAGRFKCNIDKRY